MLLKIEPAVTGLLASFIAGGASCLVLFYLNVVGHTSTDLLVQILGWVMFASLFVMASVPVVGSGLKSAKRILKPLESER